MAELLKIAEVTVDETLYPRHKVSSANIASLKQALLAGGNDIPPIVVNSKTKVLVDGLHRLRAWESVYGAEGEIPADLRDYSTRREMVEAAISLNVRNGLRLTAWDMAKSVSMLMDAKANIEKACQTLCITRSRYEELASRLKRVKGSSETVVIKANNPKLAGQESLTKEQVKFNNGPSSGMPIEFHLRQIIAAFESDSVLIDEKIEVLIREVIETLEGAIE